MGLCGKEKWKPGSVISPQSKVELRPSGSSDQILFVACELWTDPQRNSGHDGSRAHGLSFNPSRIL